MTKKYKIAEKLIEITSLYDRVHELCAGYEADNDGGEPDIRVLTTEAQIEAERGEERSFSQDYLETLAIYRQIAEAMPGYDTFLMHGSVIAVDGSAYMFTAPSGTGKSTHARLWREVFGERAVMVNDDKPLLKVTDSEVIAFGTPWNGKHRLGANIGVPLKAVAVLHRADENRAVPAKRSDIYPAILRQIYRPKDPAKMIKTMGLIDKMLDRTRLFELYCNMRREAAETAYSAMKGTQQ